MLEKFSPLPIRIGTLAFQLYSFKDAYTEFSNHLEHGDESAEPPLYGLLWPAAEALSEALWQKYKEFLPGKEVLEVGCGLALPSLVCARLGADVTAMDYHKNFETVLTHNLAANGLNCKMVRGSFADAELKLGKFDWIIASDVLYEEEQYESLEQFIIDHAKPGTIALIADPGRFAAGKFGTSLKLLTTQERSSHTLASGQTIDLYAFHFPI